MFCVCFAPEIYVVFNVITSQHYQKGANLIWFKDINLILLGSNLFKPLIKIKLRFAYMHYLVFKTIQLLLSFKLQIGKIKAIMISYMLIGIVLL